MIIEGAAKRFAPAGEEVSTMPKDFPNGTEEMWDITAKVMLRRAGGHVVHITREEMEEAAGTQCEIEMMADGSFVFRVDGKPAN